MLVVVVAIVSDGSNAAYRADIASMYLKTIAIRMRSDAGSNNFETSTGIGRSVYGPHVRRAPDIVEY